jgi:DNA-binding transcriptional regulator YhcF (GntR family)
MSSPLPLTLIDDEHTPIYLQIVHQIRYLITGRELAAGAKLPAVRTLASQLGVNSGTVALAYRTLQAEGLVVSHHGQGTYVAQGSNEAVRAGLREVLLTKALDDLIERAYALGFDQSAIRQHLTSRLHNRVRHVPLAIVMPSVEAAVKYQNLVKRHLPPNVVPSFQAVAIGALESGDPDTISGYKGTFFTITFRAMVPRVDAALRLHSLRSEVVGITARLTTKTRESLLMLDPRAPHVLVTESRNIGSVLTLVAQHSHLDVRELRILTEFSAPEEFDGESGNIHIHSFGMRPVLDANGIDPTARLELEFTLSDEAVLQLQQMLDRPRTSALT